MQKVLTVLREHWIKITSVLIFIIVISGVVINHNNTPPTWVTEKVTEGTVSQIISVSGTMNATQSANLSFPITGTLESVSIKEGDFVTKDTVLATLAYDSLTAEYDDAYAALLIAEADRTELITGLRPEERDITATKVAIAKEELARVTKEQNDRVQNAYRTLLSSNLEVRPVKNDNDNTAPTLTGTYTCAEGSYALSVFRSSARSGYSYRITGLESGTYTAYTESAAPLGICGLSIQFAKDETYSNADWVIKIPNTESSSYVTNMNAYTLAQTEHANAIHSAEQNLKLAEQNERLDIANPREESLSREDARVLQAKARVQRITAQINDHILKAPFDGTITNIEPVPGETIGGDPVVTMVSKDTFELSALIPEIDITRIAVGQKAHVVFDARASETLDASIIFISPLAREIDGVSYFETKLLLNSAVSWLQSGLNADIDIIIESREEVLRIPKRFLIKEEGSYSVLIPEGEIAKPVSVTVEFEGNDGYVHINGLKNGDTIIAP